MAEPLLEVIGLGRRFGAREVVRQLTFCVERGEMLALLGPNGAGKTTTLRLLATLLQPTSGHIYLEGLDLVRQPLVGRRRLGYLPEHLGVPEGVTAREYLDLHAACHGLSRQARRPLVEDVLQLCGLRALGGRDVSTLSRGGRQRLLLGRALVHDPDLLLLDEPLSGLDLRARQELLEVLGELARLGKAMACAKIGSASELDGEAGSGYAKLRTCGIYFAGARLSDFIRSFYRWLINR